MNVGLTAPWPRPPNYHVGHADVLDKLEKGQGTSNDVNEESIVLPGDTVGSRTVVVSLAKKSVQELRELCRGFNLKATGTKPVLADRLHEFSCQPEAWKTQLNPGARRPHLGPHQVDTSRKTSAKASMQRRNEIFGDTSMVKAGSVQPQLPTARIDTRTSQQKMNFLLWARRNVERHAAEVAAEAAELEALHLKPTTDQPQLLPPHPNSTPYSTLQLPPLLPQPPLPSSSSFLVTLPPLSSAPTAQPLLQPDTTSQSLPLAASSSSSIQSIEDRSCILRLGSGLLLHFHISDIPDGSPVPILSKDLSRLGKTWDDTHSSWDPSLASLLIKGHPIALKYWQAVYRRDPKGRWNNIKKYWHNWKMIAERWHKSTPENFWSEFTDENGKQKSYTQILEALREQRKQDCLVVAAHAQEEYGDSFLSTFSYHKKGKRVAMTDPRAVSRLYKRCKAV